MMETSGKPSLSYDLALVFEPMCLGNDIMKSEVEASLWARQRIS